MAKEDTFEVEGIIEEMLPRLQFRVRLKSGKEIIAYLRGKMRTNNIRVNVGDIVTVEMTPYDLEQGRITYRKRNTPQIVDPPQ